MIKQYIDIEGYWKVIVYYNIDYNFFDIIIKELKQIEIRDKTIAEIYRMLHSRQAKAVTISSFKYYTSIVLFNTHTTSEDYISSIVHEAEHIKQAMLKVYNVEDKDEPPAYTIGFIVKKMYEVFNKFL